MIAPMCVPTAIDFPFLSLSARLDFSADKFCSFLFHSVCCRVALAQQLDLFHRGYPNQLLRVAVAPCAATVLLLDSNWGPVPSDPGLMQLKRQTTVRTVYIYTDPQLRLSRAAEWSRLKRSSLSVRNTN